MSVREASKNFGINEATLQDKLKHVDSQRGWHGVVTPIPKKESEFAPPAHTEIQMGLRFN